MAVLEAHTRDDLITRFNINLRMVMTDWKSTHRSTAISVPTDVIGDNLTEENMDVDDDQDEKQKKQQITSSGSHSVRELKDVDYRFLNQEMDHQTMKTNPVANQRRPRRKSRFSDITPTDLDRLKKSRITSERVFPRTREKRSPIRNTASPELIDVSD